jgi:hypothetical protein
MNTGDPEVMANAVGELVRPDALIRTPVPSQVTGARNAVTGTHKGEYLGVPPTGKSITYNEIFIFRLDDDGRIAETWGVVDVASQMRQLGPTPG